MSRKQEIEDLHGRMIVLELIVVAGLVDMVRRWPDPTAALATMRRAQFEALRDVKRTRGEREDRIYDHAVKALGAIFGEAAGRLRAN